MFDLYGIDRLVEWKIFRDQLETSEYPFKDVANFWSRAPFVERYLNPSNPSSWPDPWKLILDGKYDNLAITLGMSYTLNLTNRFKKSNFIINQTIEKNPRSFLIIDNNSILNWEYRSVNCLEDMKDVSSKVLWSKTKKI